MRVSAQGAEPALRVGLVQMTA
ncbi:MAG: hypothetical protein QOC54_3833, partial [Baekduia sp.]|nr:hypothetical protein [Baekduia sp.]